MENTSTQKSRELTCIVCPRGCSLKVTFTPDGKIDSISGNACKRGITYAENECTHPKRTVTTTVKLEDGGVVAEQARARRKQIRQIPENAVAELSRAAFDDEQARVFPSCGGGLCD